MKNLSTELPSCGVFYVGLVSFPPFPHLPSEQHGPCFTKQKVEENKSGQNKRISVTTVMRFFRRIRKNWCLLTSILYNSYCVLYLCM
jgi:hypothetical protein